MCFNYIIIQSFYVLLQKSNNNEGCACGKSGKPSHIQNNLNMRSAVELLW